MKSFILLALVALSFSTVSGQICVGEQGKVQWQCWRNLYAAEYSELSALEFYPNTPDITQTIYSLNTPINYDNNMGVKISGFIHVPVTDSVTFNITGNRRCRFYLSTTSSPSNLVLRASAPDNTNEYEYTKYPEQTSIKLRLQANLFYYFEILYVEDTGSDHCKVFWKNSFISNSNWNIITAAYLNDVGCKPAPCPIRGSPCNDGNANTSGDLEDGHCHCMGKPNTSNTCIGPINKIEKFRYDNIVGSTLNDLYADPDFPGMPNTSNILPLFGTKSESQFNNIGNLVSGYITVPVSGNYKFNVTGDDNTILFISSDDSPENKQAHQVFVSGTTGMTEHTKYIYQSTSNIYLQAGQFYYIELNHKESTGNEHFGAFWQTPFTGTGVWKRIPSFFLSQYACDIACVPQGTLCDDGNPFTNDDQYNESCDCIGTPCSGLDCDSPLASYVPYEKCKVTDQFDNKASNNWLSCQVNYNPNPSRNRSHFIKYDLGERHQLISSQIWNYNVQNETNKGFQAVAIDYSSDGTSWTALNQYNWPLASGESTYGGFSGPDLSGIFARYILITSLDDTTTCRGLGKVVFKAIFCPLQGTSCNDNNALTINDVFNSNCECIGENLYVNQCLDMNLTLGDVTLPTDVYSAIHHVTSSSNIATQSTVGIIGGESVILEVGFETQPNAIFVAYIDACDSNRPPLSAASDKAQKLTDKKPSDINDLMVVPVPDSDIVDIHFKIDNPGHIVLRVIDKNNKVYVLATNKYENKGQYRKRIRTAKLSNGIHTVSLTKSNKTSTEKLIVGFNNEAIMKQYK